MLFDSISYLIFLPIVFVCYWAIPARFRRFFLLLASCYFYMSFVPKYVLILFFLITVDYFLAFAIERSESRKRKLFVVISIITNVGTLFFFKYFNFFNENVTALAQALHFNYSPYLLEIALPLGLSFHVFQSLGYIVEVYRKKYKPERNYITYALYVMFFPQLVAGPIERPQHLLPQLSLEHTFDWVKARRGLERIMWGFFKKLVIADQLSRVIGTLWAKLPGDSLTLIVVIVMFTYQLYCDFSGYTDIAIGSAMLLGFNLMENFNRPFSATSVADFWRKWHISLSSWLRDYLYYPLAFSWGKVKKYKLYLSLFITFVIIGLWHGANWTFVVFGALQGIYMIIGTMTADIRKKIVETIGLGKMPRLHKAIQQITVFALFAFSLIFFRSETIGRALWYVRYIFSPINIGYFVTQVLHNPSYVGVRVIFIPAFFAAVAMEIIQYYQAKKGTLYIFESKSAIIRYGWYYAAMIAIIFGGYFAGQTFIYFQF